MSNDLDELNELLQQGNPLSEVYSETSTTTERYSLSEAELDKMVANASIPNLAALMKQGLDSGLISPQPKYK